MSDEVEEGRGAGSDGDTTAVDDRPEVDDEPGSGPPSLPRPSRTWWLVLLAIVVVALGVRVGYTLGWKQVDTIAGDPYYYHRGANLLADGHGFVHPYGFDKGVTIPAADHPPG